MASRHGCCSHQHHRPNWLSVVKLAPGAFCQGRAEVAMSDIVPPKAKPFHLGTRHLLNATKVLGWKSLDDGDQASLAAELEAALAKCVARNRMESRSNMAADQFYATDEGKCILRQKEALQQICDASTALREGLRQYVSERGPFSDDRDEYVHSLLDRLAWRDDEIRGHGEFDSFRQTPSAADDERTAQIFDEARHYVDIVHFAANEIMETWKQGAGRPSSAHNQLVIDLQGIVSSNIHPDHPRFRNWFEQPAAPQGPLCQIFEVALEAMGEERYSNPAARVRKALQMRQVLDDAVTGYADSVVPTSFEDLLNRPD